MHFLLGVGNSSIVEYILRGLISFGAWEAGAVKRIPVPKPTREIREQIEIFSRSIYDAKAAWDNGNEVSTRFCTPWILINQIGSQSKRMYELLLQLLDFEAAEDSRLQQLYAKLDDTVYQLYSIPDKVRKNIEHTLRERPAEVIWPQMEGKSAEQKRMEHVWRLLSYVVKRVVEADEDGIVPYLTLSGESSLLDRFYKVLEAQFPGQSVSQVEVEIVNELKCKVKGYRSVNSIREWLEDVYFEYHVSLYKNRPIFWHIASAQGKTSAAFGALVQYHKFDKNRMAKLRGTYLRDAIDFFHREAALASQERRESDRLEWQTKLEEAQELDRRLQLIQEGHFEGKEGGNRDFRILTPWKSAEERPKGWDPDIDDGVKVNIEPLQKAGVLRRNDLIK